MFQLDGLNWGPYAVKMIYGSPRIEVVVWSASIVDNPVAGLNIMSSGYFGNVSIFTKYVLPLTGAGKSRWLQNQRFLEFSQIDGRTLPDSNMDLHVLTWSYQFPSTSRA